MMMRRAAVARAMHHVVPAEIRSIRLCSGLVLMSYIGLHLTNHALGNVSLAWMERALLVQKFIWQGVIGTTALYAALTAHFVLGLWALYERRQVHWKAQELVQLGLGLAIPPLIANHVVATRIAFTTFGLDKGYAQELYSFWIASPFLGGVQLTLLVVAWTHGCLGVWFWLRIKRWFARLQAPLMVVAVLLPVLALLGYLQAGRTVVQLATDPVWRAAATPPAIVGTAPQNIWLASLRNGFLLFDGVAVAAVLLARLGRSIRERRSGRFRVNYPGGQRPMAPIGLSVLEVSLRANIPHATACGGRGRCTLCRVRVMGEGIPPPNELERRVLARLGVAPGSVRLACQLRPRRDLSVIPLVPPEAQHAFLHRRQTALEAQERFLVHMFIDMRDSTRFAATRLPHDTVFLLGRFIGAVSAAVLDAGGVPNQFLGDGILAIFGMDTPPRTACLQALDALGRVARNVRMLGALLEREMAFALRFGIGVQCGRTIIGEVGFRHHVTVTGLGDPPNVASRLQGLSRELGCEAVVAEDVFHTAGLSGEVLPLHAATLRGRDVPVSARLFFSIEADLGRVMTSSALFTPDASA